MINETTGNVCAEGESTSCFTDAEGRLITLKKDFPGLHTLLEALANQQD